MTDTAPHRPPRRPRLRITVQDGLILGLAAVVMAQVVLFVRMERNPPPRIVTVGVRQITHDYVSKLASSNISQEEARIRTELYLAVAQDVIKRMSVVDGVLIVARECVLAGEHADLTTQVSTAVGEAFAKASGAVTARQAPPPQPPTSGVRP